MGRSDFSETVDRNWMSDVDFRDASSWGPFFLRDIARELGLPDNASMDAVGDAVKNLARVRAVAQTEKLSERKHWNGSWFCAEGCTYWHDGYHVISCRFVSNGARRGYTHLVKRLEDLAREWRRAAEDRSKAYAVTYQRCAKQLGSVLKSVESAPSFDAVDPSATDTGNPSTRVP